MSSITSSSTTPAIPEEDPYISSDDESDNDSVYEGGSSESGSSESDYGNEDEEEEAKALREARSTGFISLSESAKLVQEEERENRTNHITLAFMLLEKDSLVYLYFLGYYAADGCDVKDDNRNVMGIFQKSCSFIELYEILIAIGVYDSKFQYVHTKTNETSLGVY
jgi:hypothetical protein